MDLRSFHSPEGQLFFDGQRPEQIHRRTMKIGHATQTNKELAGRKKTLPGCDGHANFGWITDFWNAILQRMEKGDEQNESSKPIQGGIFLIIGGLIGWTLGVTTNGVFNFFSDSPAIQLYPFCFSVCAGVCFVSFRVVFKHIHLSWLYVVASLFCALFWVGTETLVTRKEFISKPRLQLFLQVGDLPTDVLWFTNASLTQFQRLNIRTPDNPLFALYARNCLIFPVLPEQTNVFLDFAVRNASARTVHGNDLIFTVALPKEWHGALEGDWHPANVFLKLPDNASEMWLTNKTSWATQIPVPLFSANRFHFPSIRIDTITQPTNKPIDGIAANLRATGVDSVFVTYIAFLPITATNFSKPFFAPIEADTNGHIKFLISAKKIEELQK